MNVAQAVGKRPGELVVAEIDISEGTKIAEAGGKITSEGILVEMEYL